MRGREKKDFFFFFLLSQRQKKISTMYSLSETTGDQLKEPALLGGRAPDSRASRTNSANS